MFIYEFIVSHVNEQNLFWLIKLTSIDYGGFNNLVSAFLFKRKTNHL